MNIQERADKVVEQFRQFTDWEEAYKHLIERGRQLEPLPEGEKTEDNLVRGCTSQVWLNARCEQGKITFGADSDALLVKGIIALLLAVYNHARPRDILGHKPDFIEKIGLAQHLSMNRANGLAALLGQIRNYAIAFAHLEGR